MRRSRSPHSGVVLIPPEPGRAAWRARFVDPDTDRTAKVSLDPTALRTHEARRAWAITKSKTLAKRRMDLEAGAPRATGTAMTDAIDAYYRANPQLRAKTLTGYRSVTAKLLTWATESGVQPDTLTRAQLLKFRESLMSEPRKAQKRGGKRGSRVATAKRRSPHSINRELRATRTVLGHLVDADLLPRCTHDDLRRALKRIEAPRERIHYLKGHEIQKLLDAAQRNDAETFAETRTEHAGDKPRGTTARYVAIAPFVAAAVLTGMRLGELLALDWRNVDLEAPDDTGEPAGEIHITAASKTHRARTVVLEVSPALHQLLAALWLRAGRPKEGSVFGVTLGDADAGMARLANEYGAPTGSTWQGLRRTCGTFLTNAPGIFGAASAYRSAKQLGHSVEVAERHYVDLVRGIPRDARTLEDAMGIASHVSAITRRVSEGNDRSRPAARARG